MSLLSVSNLYFEGLPNNFALRDISFTQDKFQKIALIGESGCGKSTLLKIIAGFIQPNRGKIIFDNIKVKGPDWQLVAGQKGIAYLSQHFELRNNYRMEELLMYTNELSDAEAADLYKICRIDHLMKRNSYQLSGGEKQRLALARLLVSKPSLLILDEPYSNLDLIHKNILKSVVENVCTKFEITCILTSHDPNDVLPWADEILVLQQGEIIQKGTAKEVYKNPVNEYCAALLGCYNILSKKGISLLNIGFKNNFACFRPNDFKIVVNKNNSIKVTITAVKYMGSHYELTVEYIQIKIILNSSIEFKIGEEIFIQIGN